MSYRRNIMKEKEKKKIKCAVDKNSTRAKPNSTMVCVPGKLRERFCHKSRRFDSNFLTEQMCI